MPEKGQMSKDFPAFPLFVDWTNKMHVRDIKIHEGMTLRDYFAAQALAGILADENVGTNQPQNIADDCYRLADAMLAARSK